ncbi:hypothetical protein NLU13_6363 [Sarocladium strictum]|uniref:Uncharacterized protein n=1 Tax=Sarocladium strictum TaxID=5046 RepID=A0AA39GFR9_SARSR|nr:hypothetical protein NLU13_6363 [Sarocladium strictum]
MLEWRGDSENLELNDGGLEARTTSLGLDQTSQTDQSWTDYAPETLINGWQRSVDMATKVPGSVNEFDPSSGPFWAKDHQSTRPSSFDESEELKAFTDVEVLTALNLKNARNVGGIPPTQAEETIRQRYHTLHNLESCVQQATAINSSLNHRIASRSAQLDRVFLSLTPAVVGRLRQQQKRRDEIYRHVSGHLREVQELCEIRQKEAARAMAELDDMQEIERDLSERIADLAGKMGLDEGVDLDEIERRIWVMRAEEEEKDMAMMF